MELYCRISSKPDLYYKIAVDASFSYTANEELDSANIILTHINNNDRIIDLKPYDWICFYTKDANNNYVRLSIRDEIMPRMLIDTFNEKEININEHIYEYTISCMSETKLLEKIQLPDRQWMAKPDGTKKTIAQVIDETMQLYMLKVKVHTEDYDHHDIFEYDYLIKWNMTEINAKFNQPLNDISMSAPTLRQALSSFMTQVGCIPVVKDGWLKWLDMRDESNIFTAGNTMNYFERSMASDSYVNSLVSHGKNILDTENITVNETLHFMDKENVLLKQKENLYLETSKPIYYVNKLVLNCYGKTEILVVGSHTGNIAPGLNVVRDGETNIKIKNISDEQITITKIEIYCYLTGLLEPEKTFGLININSNDEITIDPECNPCIAIFTINNKKYAFSENHWLTTPQGQPLLLTFKINIKYSTDITPLCVEQSKRQLLETDYLAMEKPISGWTMEELSKYIYGTVGYVKGEKRIEGFSESYTTTNGFYDEEKTYIENIFISGLFLNKEYSSFELNSFFGVESKPITWLFNRFEIVQREKIAGFTNIWFDIEYQPMNELKFNVEKEYDDLPFRIEQLDNSQSAILNMDNLFLAQKDKVNRLGQDIMSINQRTENLADIQKIPSQYNDYTIFKRVISFGFNSINVNYFASKNYIIKNYFTSIATKYRAYAYSSYDETIVRKENIIVYAKLDKNIRYDGTDKVVFGSLLEPTKYHNDLLSMFIPANEHKLSYAFQYGKLDTNENAAFINEMSIITSGKTLILNYQEFDSVSPGITITDTTEYTDEKYEKIEALGGTPQKWYVWKEPDCNSRCIGFISSDLKDFFSTETIGVDIDDAKQSLNYILTSPLASQYANIPFEDLDTQIILYDVNNNHEKLWYKDQSEIMNQALQFVYYSTDENVKLGKIFTDFICWRGKNKDLRLLKLVSGATITSMPEFDDERHGYSALFESADNNACSIARISGSDNIGLRLDFDKAIHYNGRYYLRFIYLEQAPYWRDVCEFSISDEEYYESYDGVHHYVVFWLTLNDTKTDKVFNMSGSIPTLDYKVEGRQTSYWRKVVRI